MSATATEASKMLEAALQQMDGIISNTAATTTLSERNLISATNVLSTAKTLALALQQVGLAAPAPDPVTAAIISDWLETHIPRQDCDERMRRLQRDKEGLALQYQMLAERVSEQADKIIELEGMLTEKTQQLCSKEELLQRQMISRSALETQKLELMSALSELKLHRTALERESELHGNEIGNGIPYGSVGNLHQRGFPGEGVTAPKTPPSALRHQIKPQFHSLPRSHVAGRTSLNNNSRALDVNANNSGGKQRNVMFASNEQIMIDDRNNMGKLGSINDDGMSSSCISQSQSTPSPKLRDRSVRGLRNIFGKLRRSNSSNCELTALEQAEPEFRRGGSRATAGGRIEWSAQTPLFGESSKNYKSWDVQEVCDWLSHLGLGSYEENCRKWLKANPTVSFFTAAPVDIERELNLKLPLHRKKILLAIDDVTGKERDELTLLAAKLDVGWVLRWLDDIGLPQYKDYFLQAKVDGRMLHRLTLEDLAQLHVSSCLHIASLRSGIQCMRRMNWNAEGLIRRSSSVASPPDEVSSSDTDKVELWTAHRVMEWLRVVDLSEYAPNLRGAGVHGALMVYESRFNADLLADLLSIPPSKSLLRRHLSMHFKGLVGREVIHIKRDAEVAPGYKPLTITAKLKPPKRTQFTLKRRKSTKGQNDVDWSDLVCPMDSAIPLEITKTQLPNEHEGSLSLN